MPKPKLSVGQKLWYVPRSRHGQPRDATVKAVGRKWAQIDYGERVNIETLCVEGGGYTRCYLSKEHYETVKAIENAWSDFRRQISDTYNAPEGMTVERIKAAREALGI